MTTELIPTQALLLQAEYSGIRVEMIYFDHGDSTFSHLSHIITKPKSGEWEGQAWTYETDMSEAAVRFSLYESVYRTDADPLNNLTETLITNEADLFAIRSLINTGLVPPQIGASYNIVSASGDTNTKRYEMPQELPEAYTNNRPEYSEKAEEFLAGLDKSIAGRSGTTEVDLGVADLSEIKRPNGQRYMPRTWDDSTDVQRMRVFREHSLYPFLTGAPGTGKTALAEAAFGDELETVVFTGDTAERDLVGQFIPNPESGKPTGEFTDQGKEILHPEYLWVDGPLTRAMKNGHVLLADEVGLGDPKVLSILYGAMDGRREIVVTANPAVGTVKAEDGFFVVAATNPRAPGANMSEALLSRFLVQFPVTTDYAMASQLDVTIEIVKVARQLGTLYNSNKIGWAPQMREMLAFRDIEKALGTQFAISNLISICPEDDREILVEKLNYVYDGFNMVPSKI